MAANGLGGLLGWSDLFSIYQRQGGKCHYTGRPITIGLDAELDHKKPKSRFPHLIADQSNLAFCHASINAWKGARTDDEFVAMCKEVASFVGQGHA